MKLRQNTWCVITGNGNGEVRFIAGNDKTHKGVLHKYW